MGNWYSVGVFAGFGVAIGIAFVGGFGGRRLALAALLTAAVAGIAIGLVFADPEEAVAGGVGGLLGAAGAVPIVGGARRRGGTRLAVGTLMVVAAVVVAALALVPVVGYVEALVVPALGMRLRRRSGKRYAGLRTLARD